MTSPVFSSSSTSSSTSMTTNMPMLILKPPTSYFPIKTPIRSVLLSAGVVTRLYSNSECLADRLALATGTRDFFWYVMSSFLSYLNGNCVAQILEVSGELVQFGFFFLATLKIQYKDFSESFCVITSCMYVFPPYFV